MLLKKVKIANFRGFNSIEVELDRTTVLIWREQHRKNEFP